ncbi:D-alanyl-D-alanine carboxypeptidase [Vibrio zhanjiangensis]|uniref:serine-type D-Ala-D-Ala carboxypeptidase n=1 Tax=Vibrio zhanjiangensis TaxID=1046128 RepID=A0ABQ6F033_9VIBR|nr:D-alanyl-D-alanine carboxypeptidase family protein [Vibrio zhanjiangensis]GLT18848.1 D-alanyl-D-alanine carboxypeptidase [Vibrio zhanjiangensis]
MMRNFLRRATLWCTLTVTFCAYSTPTIVPDPPALAAKGYVLIDYNTGQVLAEKNANTKLNPASLTKLMTAYVAGQEVKAGNVTLNDQVLISKKAWAKNFPDSSKMFIEVGTKVPLMDLYRGLIVQSGNDASVAIAEYVAGSESAFVNMMNSWAEKLGLENTAYTNPHGLDSRGLYSTPLDIAKLGQAIIRDLPDIYSLYSETSYTYNGITQYNRNGLLRDRSMNVDGMKTGYTRKAGYSMATSATFGNMRLIAVVMGAESAKSRESVSKQLLSYGFRFFDTVSPTKANDVVTSVRVWMGDKDQLSLGVSDDIYLTLPRGDADKLVAQVEFDRELVAPIAKGEKVGSVVYKVDDETVLAKDLVAKSEIKQGSIIKRIIDWFKRLISGWL